MEGSNGDDGFVFPFKENEAEKIRDKAKVIYRKTTALIKSLKRRT